MTTQEKELKIQKKYNKGYQANNNISEVLYTASVTSTCWHSVGLMPAEPPPSSPPLAPLAAATSPLWILLEPN